MSAASIGDAAEAVGSAAADAAGSAGGYVGDAVGAIGGAVDAATFGGASAALNLVDDTVFDGVDYVTGGVVDIDFDDGKFSASVGIDGVADVGASIGEHGLTVVERQPDRVHRRRPHRYRLLARHQRGRQLRTAARTTTATSTSAPRATCRSTVTSREPSPRRTDC